MSVPFLNDMSSVLDLLGGKDIELVDFRPPRMSLRFEVSRKWLIFTCCLSYVKVYLELGFSATATLEIAMVRSWLKFLLCGSSQLIIIVPPRCLTQKALEKLCRKINR